MKIRTLRPVAFGKFHMDSPIEMADGLNIVSGENEAGKSTLGAFVLGMFYGFKKEGKTRISRSPEFDRYRPWSGTDYRGSLTYEEGGRTYRIERSFDPDWVRIYDDVTGEDLTSLFTQDSRKEYDFAQRHLGLSQKEFRNTVWIGQLGSAQEPGLGNEIQGKLESILGGGDEDVPLTRALGALYDEGAKLKLPRSTKARLDLLRADIDKLEAEMAAAAAREENVREDLALAAELGREKADLQARLSRGEAEIHAARYALLQGILSRAQELESQASSLREKIGHLEWARDLAPDCEESLRGVRNGQELAQKRLAELEAEARDLAGRQDALKSRVAELGRVESLGIDEATLASMYPTRYSLAKGQATKCERATNQARHDLRAVEEEGRQKGYPAADLDADVLRKAEDFHETLILAEKTRSRMELDAERARAAVASLGSGGSYSIIYAVALAILGAAVAFTILGLPAGWPLFAAAFGVFGFGVVRHRSSAERRRAAAQELEERESEAAGQLERIEEARKSLSGYLAALGASSIDELRQYAREISAYRARLKAAKDKFDQAQAAWFEASAEFSVIENELLGFLRSARALGPGEVVNDAAVASLRRGLRELQVLKQQLADTESQQSALLERVSRQSEAVERAATDEAALLEAAGVSSTQELEAKIATHKEHMELSRTAREVEERAKALLSGRNTSEIRVEIAELSSSMGSAPVPGLEVSDRDYETMREAQEAARQRLNQAEVELARLENGIRLRSEAGRPSAVIEEDLSRLRALDEELSREHAALVLAHDVLKELSAGVRREFAPALNKRVGEILGRITMGRYTQIMVSPDLEMSVIHPETGVQTQVDALSGGTLDQCYFALRVAIAEAVTRKDESPFFLDDSFVQYDDRRLEGVLAILGALSNRHQMLVFSCHGREERVARGMGLPYHKVALR